MVSILNLRVWRDNHWQVYLTSGHRDGGYSWRDRLVPCRWSALEKHTTYLLPQVYKKRVVPGSHRKLMLYNVFKDKESNVFVVNVVCTFCLIFKEVCFQLFLSLYALYVIVFISSTTSSVTRSSGSSKNVKKCFSGTVFWMLIAVRAPSRKTSSCILCDLSRFTPGTQLSSFFNEQQRALGTKSAYSLSRSIDYFAWTPSR